MALSFPRDIIDEAYLNGWTDVTSYVRQTDAVVITGGEGGEQAKVAPGSLTCTFDNRSGDMDPQNPLGPFYGLLGRNTPYRRSLRLVRDRFTRTVVNGWGSADTGEAWANTGNGTPLASDFQVTGSVGTHSVPAVTTFRRSTLPTRIYSDCEVRVTLTSVGFTDVTGGSIEPANLIVRGTESGSADYYLARVTIEADQSVTVAILRISSGFFLNPGGPITVPGLTYTGQPLTVVMQAERQTIRAKVYDSSGTNKEPSTWHATATGATGLTSGFVGIRSGISSSNTNTKPIVFSYDNFEVRNYRFTGELSDMRRWWDEHHRDKWVDVVAGDLLRRVQTSTRPLKTALERFIVNHDTQPLAYWPLDDEGEVTFGRVAAGSGKQAVLKFSSNPVKPGRAFGTGRISQWFNPVAKVDHSSVLLCDPVEPYAGGWTAHCSLAFPGGKSSSTPNPDGLVFGSLNAGFWQISFESNDGTITIVKPGQIAVATVSASVYDDNTHLISLQTVQAGSDVNWSFAIDKLSVASGTATGLTNPVMARASFTSMFLDDDRERAIGHMVLYSELGVSYSEIYDAFLGHAGETAGRRVERLCREHGLDFQPVGDLDASTAMGPQYPDPLPKIFEECVASDLGRLFCSRSGAISYRTRQNLYNQSPSLTLDYAARQVFPPLLPAHDDKNTVNLVEAKRRDGGEYTAEQTSGPLNTNDPLLDPNGVGIVDGSVDTNVQYDSLLGDVAGFLLNVGTTAEDRFPEVTVNMRTGGIAGNDTMETAVLSMGVGRRLSITNLQAANIYRNLELLATGYQETFAGKTEHTIKFATIPASPYDVLRLDDTARGKLNAADSKLTISYNSSATSLQAAFVTDRWTTTAAHFPIPITIAGEDMTLTAVSGTTSPQTLTVTRNPLTAKTLPADSPVRLTRRATIA